MSPDGLAESMSGPYGGIVVLDSDLQVVFTWKSNLACPLSPCQFAGIKKFKGQRIDGENVRQQLLGCHRTRVSNHGAPLLRR